MSLSYKILKENKVNQNTELLFHKRLTGDARDDIVFEAFFRIACIVAIMDSGTIWWTRYIRNTPINHLCGLVLRYTSKKGIRVCICKKISD